MNIELTSLEARVIGCLIEKEITTPEQYPLSLNALVNACNQKSSREPVMALSDSDVQNIVDGLDKKHLISEKTGFGSRVVKYKHRLCNTEFSELQLSEQALGLMCVLLLRGPQTPGELRTRTNRLCRFDDVNKVESVLRELAAREDALVVELAREPGKRDARYAHLLSGEVSAEALAPVAAVAAAMEVPLSPDRERIELLELLVDELRQELDELKKTVQAMRD